MIHPIGRAFELALRAPRISKLRKRGQKPDPTLLGATEAPPGFGLRRRSAAESPLSLAAGECSRTGEFAPTTQAKAGNRSALPRSPRRWRASVRPSQSPISDAEAYPIYTSYSTNLPRWYESLQPYTQNGWFGPLFKCPGYKGITASIVMGSPSEGSYACNAFGVADEFEGLGLGGIRVNNSLLQAGFNPIREAKVLNPANLITLADSVLGRGFSSTSPSGPILSVSGGDEIGLKWWHGAGSGMGSTARQAEIRNAARQAEAIRHRGKYNILFGDSHQESLVPAALFATNLPALMRWNNDNDPHRAALQLQPR